MPSRQHSELIQNTGVVLEECDPSNTRTKGNDSLTSAAPYDGGC